ncbi:hypothetical protein BG005_006597 [Podila minutissima]|nr:hypothetical protein BG005_006597 [Podila minutissima]
MRPSLSTVALSATLAITFLALSTPDLTSAQRIAAAVEHITILGTNDLHSASSKGRFLHKTLIRAGETPHAHKGRFWVDFHDTFTNTDRATFEKVVAAHPGLEIRHEFWESLNAVSIEVADDEGVLQELVRSVPGIRLIEPVILRQAPKVAESSFKVSMEAVHQTLLPKVSSHDITGVLGVHEKLGLYGKGIKIGIIDTGIDYTSPNSSFLS